MDKIYYNTLVVKKVWWLYNCPTIGYRPKTAFRTTVHNQQFTHYKHTIFYSDKLSLYYTPSLPTR